MLVDKKTMTEEGVRLTDKNYSIKAEEESDTEKVNWRRIYPLEQWMGRWKLSNPVSF